MRDPVLAAGTQASTHIHAYGCKLTCHIQYFVRQNRWYALWLYISYFPQMATVMSVLPSRAGSVKGEGQVLLPTCPLPTLYYSLTGLSKRLSRNVEQKQTLSSCA